MEQDNSGPVLGCCILRCRIFATGLPACRKAGTQKGQRLTDMSPALSIAASLLGSIEETVAFAQVRFRALSLPLRSALLILVQLKGQCRVVILLHPHIRSCLVFIVYVLFVTADVAIPVHPFSLDS